MRTFHIFIALLFFSLSVQAQHKDETLLLKSPPGYKIELHRKLENTLTTQMVPVGESLNDWTETLAVNVFLGEKSVSVAQFQSFAVARWLEGCPRGVGVTEVKAVDKGLDNGYLFATWKMTCIRQAQPNRSEFAWFKAIKGNDSFYVVQKSFRVAPSTDQQSHWLSYLVLD